MADQRRYSRQLGLAIVILALATPLAAAPWSKVAPGKRPAAKADERYPLTENNGPWMIMACSFTGEGAADQAQRLVQELRSKYRLTAYTYEGTFDFSKPIEGRGVDRYGGPQAMRYRNGKKITEIAVMVGDYQDVADHEAQKMLKKIKYMRPASLETGENQTTSQSLAAVRAIQRAVLPADSEERKKGPMGGAFVTTNPLLPRDYFVPKGIDKLVVEMNKGVKYGLLDCPGRYTVKVATFTGQVIVDQKQIESIEHGSSMKSRLAEAAEKAHKLTETLRAKGVQAYEFHDRYTSIVTIGGFNSVGTPRADGKTEINPAIHTLMKTYGAETKVVPGQAAPQVGRPKMEGSIPFDVQPMPVEVPKRSIAADYGRTADRR